MALTELFYQIANSIRQKDGSTEPIVANQFPQRILNIPSGGGIACKTGTMMFNEAISNFITIEHELGRIPQIIIFLANVNNTLRDDANFNGFISANTLLKDCIFIAKSGSVREMLGSYITSNTENSTTFSISDGVAVDGVEYRWYVIGGVT